MQLMDAKWAEINALLSSSADALYPCISWINNTSYPRPLCGLTVGLDSVTTVGRETISGTWSVFGLVSD